MNKKGRRYSDDNFIDMQVTMEGNVEILFEFEDFEHVIQLAKRLSYYWFLRWHALSMNNRILFLIENVCQDTQTQIATLWRNMETLLY